MNLNAAAAHGAESCLITCETIGRDPGNPVMGRILRCYAVAVVCSSLMWMAAAYAAWVVL